MNTQKQIEALETKLAEVSAELQRLKGRKAGQWVPQVGERYLALLGDEISIEEWEGHPEELRWLARGRIFPDTAEGREAAEWFAFCEGFRARWKRSADVSPSGEGFLPYLTSWGALQIENHYSSYGLPKWSTTEACRAFVDSEGGPEKVKEILKRGIL